MPDPQSPSVEAQEPSEIPRKANRSRKLARWFWGAIIVMAVASVALTVVGVLRQSPEPAETHPPSSPSPVAEATAAELDDRLDSANRAAIAKVREKIIPLLEEAYRPVYSAIPSYADYHYSVWGEYAELTAAALGDVGTKLQETLFSSLETRLVNVGIQLDSIFNETFQSSLETGTGAGPIGGGALGELTQAAIRDAQRRMLVTAPVGTTAAIGTGVAVKAAAQAMAKKIAAKLALKAAAKTGGKWVVVSAGAGTAAALCSWTGPGAAFCAAAGGVGAWIIADYGIVKLDEFWNRDEFEADLQTMVDEQKAEHREALERAITARALAVQEVSDEIVKNHDFTLRELYGEGNEEVCAIAEALKAQYEPIQTSLSARTPEAIQELRNAADMHRRNLSLERMVAEIIANLKTAESVRITKVQVSGNLPRDYRADRDVSVRLVIDGTPQNTITVESSAKNGFSTSFYPGSELQIDRPTSFGVQVEQHLRLWNRYFGGYDTIKFSDNISNSIGIFHSLDRDVPISRDESASAIEKVSTIARAGQVVTLAVQLHAEALPSLKDAPKCQ